MKPAPIQVTAIGYPNGTGLPNMHYRLSDFYADSSSAHHHYRERLIRMPKYFLPQIELPVNHQMTTKKNLGLSNDSFVFVSFNQIHKLNPELLHTWDKILLSVPNAYLIIGSVRSDLAFIQNSIKEYFSSKIRKRILFMHRVKTEEQHRARYGIADVALDAFPYSGTTTSYESLYMGVPIITLLGDRHVQRTTYSLLKNLGIGETIANTKDEYTKLAVTLANDPKSLVSLKKKIQNALSKNSTYNAAVYTRDLEKAYRMIWERYKNGLEPAEIHIR